MHTILWEFEAREEKKHDFIRAYGSDGDWAMLFRRGNGYKGTELLRSTNKPNVFVTIDRWANAEDFENFRKQFNKGYCALDARFSALTLNEKKLGSFESEDC